MIEAAIRDICTSGTLSPLTSAVIGQRIHQGELPQAPAYPCIVFHIIFDSSDYTHDGPSGLQRARVQLDCLAEKQSDANALARHVRAELGAIKRQRVAGSPGVMVQGVFHESGSDDTASEMLNAGPRVGLRRVEVQVHFGA